jgi:hypothetical protein
MLCIGIVDWVEIIQNNVQWQTFVSATVKISINIKEIVSYREE